MKNKTINEKCLKSELDALFLYTNDNNLNVYDMNSIDRKTNININMNINININIKIKKKLILSGGGVKGIAQIGALHSLYNNNILQNIDTFAASSIGAVNATLIVIGYKPIELLEFFSGLNLKNLGDPSFNNLLNLFGLDDGLKLEFVIKKLIIAKDIDPYITLEELFKKTNKTLIITTVCLNEKRAYYNSHKTNPHIPLIIALRMSISIPLYFVPVLYKNQLFIDGGCIDNYPIQLFNDCLDEVIGIYLSEKRDNTEKIDNIENYLYNTIECLFEGVACNSIKGYEKYTIKIKIEKTNMIDFNIDDNKKRQLFNIGFKTVEDFLKNFCIL